MRNAAINLRVQFIKETELKKMTGNHSPIGLSNNRTVSGHIQMKHVIDNNWGQITHAH